MTETEDSGIVRLCMMCDKAYGSSTEEWIDRAEYEKQYGKGVYSHGVCEEPVCYTQFLEACGLEQQLVR